MSRPIIVGVRPEDLRRAPVNFGVAAARFTGARLSWRPSGVGAPVPVRSPTLPSPSDTDEDLVVDASAALDEARRELEPEGIAVECRAAARTRAPHARCTR